jgi:hypothetical protein
MRGKIQGQGFPLKDSPSRTSPDRNESRVMRREKGKQTTKEEKITTS